MSFESFIAIVRELGSFGVIIWLIVFEIPKLRATIDKHTSVLEKFLDKG